MVDLNTEMYDQFFPTCISVAHACVCHEDATVSYTCVKTSKLTQHRCLVTTKSQEQAEQVYIHG